MNTFNSITGNIIHETDDILQKTLLQILMCRNYSVRNKHLYVNECLKNIFFNDKIKLDFVTLFNKIQRTYMSFVKFGYLYKYKRSKIVVDTDLCMNKLEETSKNVICLYQNNNRYLFTIQDLIKIISASLVNSHDLFSVPLNIKNPYNNVPFDKSTLYNIYFFARFKMCMCPELLIHFFNVNFNIRVFCNKYEYLVRDHIILNHIQNSTEDVLYEEIYCMLEHAKKIVFKKKRFFKIDPLFPKKTLIEIMMPYLKLWFAALHSLVSSIRQLSYELLIKKFKIFLVSNLKFGRRYINRRNVIVNNRVKKTLVVTFDCTHPRFLDETTDHYLKSHLVK